VKRGFGTDLLGPLWEEQSREFLMRSAVEKPMEIILSATRINAQVLNQAGTLGELSLNAAADILVLDRDPLQDIAVLADSRYLRVIMKAGEVYKNTL